MTTYTGRGFDQIVNYIDANGVNGSIVGKLIRITGEKVATVEFSIQNDNLYLLVNGVEFSSITSALVTLESELSTNDATGSDGSGNVANNVIGNYAIMRHVVFGNSTLEQIIGTSDIFKARLVREFVKSTQTVSKSRVLSSIARIGIYKLYNYATISGISKHFNISSTRMSYLLDTLSTNEYQLMFGTSRNNFDLSVYK
jgi:hypothetical protein